MKATGALYGVDRFSPTASTASLTAAAVAIARFSGSPARLALLSESTDVAVFWPASGFAVGIQIVLGPRARVAVVIGVVFATIAANVMSDRCLWTSVFKGLLQCRRSCIDVLVDRAMVWSRHTDRSPATRDAVHLSKAVAGQMRRSIFVPID